MKGYVVHAFCPGPYGHGDWVTLATVYRVRKSAQQRARRAQLYGIPNTSSGCGKRYVRDTYLEEVRVR